MASTASSSDRLQRWLKFKGRRVGALSRLAKALGYASVRDPEFTRRIQLLTERRGVDIQQSGYVGESMHHIKLVSMNSEAFQLLQRSEREPSIENNPDDSQSKKMKVTRHLIRHGRSYCLLPNDWSLGMRLDAVDVRIVAKVSRHGCGLYFRIPQSITEWFGLVAGDKVKIIIAQRKRWTSIEEDS